MSVPYILIPRILRSYSLSNLLPHLHSQRPTLRALKPRWIRSLSIKTRNEQNNAAGSVSVEIPSSSPAQARGQGEDEHGTTSTRPANVPADQSTGGRFHDSLRAHQFDTYKLVMALQCAGFTQPQATGLMKCLRTLLVNGTEVAKSNFLSRSDLENVSIS